MTGRLTDLQKTQILHIAYPEIYEAAMSGTPLWLSLWLGSTRLKDLKRTKVIPFMAGPDAILTRDHFGWVSSVSVPSRLLELGVTFGKHDVPFVRIPLDLSSTRVEVGDTVTLRNDVKAYVTG